MNNPITEAFEAGWMKRGDACYPTAMEWEYTVALEQFKNDPKRRSFHKLENGTPGTRLVVGVNPGTYCIEREHIGKEGAEIVGIYINVERGKPLFLHIPANSDTRLRGDGCFCSPEQMRKMALEMLQFADAIDYERRKSES